MEERTCILGLIAMLTLLAVAEGHKILDVRYFTCQWAPCNYRLICGFGLWDPDTPWSDVQCNLTLDDSETVRCEQSSSTKTEIHCIYEGLREKKFADNEVHKFTLRLEKANEIQIQEFSQNGTQMVLSKEKLASLRFPTNELCDNSSYLRYEPSLVLIEAYGRVTKPEPLANGFYYDLEKEELLIYWQPEKKNVKYTVTAGKGKEASEVTEYFGIFQDWNSDQPASVTICSENFARNSIRCSNLDVPILTNARRRQPQDVWYDINTNRLTWRHPIYDEHVNYTVYWCLISLESRSTCDTQNSFHSQTLNRSETQFPFSETITLYNTAVVATYSDGISGGLRWSTPAPIDPHRIRFMVITIGTTMLTMFALIVFSLALLRKVRYMTDIKVTLPDFQVKLVKTSSFTTPNSAAPVEGHFSPKAMGITLRKKAEEPIPQNLDGQTMRRNSEDQYTESRPDRRLSTSSYGYGPPPSVPPAVSENISKVVGYTEMTVL